MAKKKIANRQLQPKKVRSKADPVPRWHLPFILLITFVAYLPVLNAGFVNWDDPDYVQSNPLIKDLSRLAELLITPVQGNHHPLTMMSLAINYAISGEEAWSYHLLNLLIHLVNTYLVYRLSLLLSNNQLIVAFTTSILFAIHPLHVESVAWVSERKDLLYGLFFLSGLISYTKYIDKGSNKMYWLTLIFLVLSLMSKAAAVIFPVSLFCIDLLRKRKLKFNLLTEKIPYFIPAVIMGAITITAQKEAGAAGVIDFGLEKNILFGFYGIMTYFIKMILPFNLSAFYPFPAINEKLPVIYYVAPLFTLLLALLVYLTWKKNRWVVFGISFYIVNLLLVLQIFSVGSAIIAERYTYIPYIGLFFVIGGLVNRLARGHVMTAYYSIIPVSITLSIITYKQSQTWKDGTTLWDNVIKHQPCSRAYSSRATIFRKEKNYDKAIEYYTEAIRLNTNDHEAYNNRANIYVDLGKLDMALLDYKNSMYINPDFYTTLDNIGAMYAMKQMFDSGLYYLNKALHIKPDYKPALINHGLVMMNLKRYDESISDWKKILDYEPKDATALNSIGICFRLLGKLQEALKYINNAILVDPQAAFYLNRSYTYSAMNDTENARKDALNAKHAGMQLETSYSASLGLQ